MSQTIKIELKTVADDAPQYKAVMRLEKRLKVKLDVIIKHIKAEQLKDLNVIHFNYQTALQDCIENTVTQVYLVGSQYVNSFLKRDMKLTQADLSIIKTLSAEFYSRMTWRINQYILQRDPTRPELSNDFITSTFAAYVCPQTLNIATREKTRQIMVNKNAYIPKTAAIKQIELQLIPTGLESTYIPDPPAIAVGYVWVSTLDDKTCSFCATLNGTLFDINDPNIPGPDSIHSHCRCLIILQEI